MVLKVLLKFSLTLVLVHGWLFPGLFSAVGFLYGAGAETLILVTGTLGHPGRNPQNSGAYSESQEKQRFRYPGADIQTLEVDTRLQFGHPLLRQSF